MGGPVSTPEQQPDGPAPGPLADTGGRTPRGFPYPGPDSTDAGIATYLQDLAEAITGSLASAGTGLVFDTFQGQLTVPEGSSYVPVPFPKLREMKGGVAIAGGGRPLVFMWYPIWDLAFNTHPEDWYGVGRLMPNWAKHSGPGTMITPIMPPGTVFWVFTLAWGTPSGA
jgi:hypothetical protein